jgi:pseudouridine-5'-monophosphatase
MPTAEPMPGARELTAALHAMDVPLAVATSSTRASFALKTRRHGAWFGRDFRAVVTGDDPRIERGKPAPDIFLVAARDLGATPSACVVIEDAPSGVAAARAAGMQVVAVPDPGMDRARYGDAQLVVDSLRDLGPADLGFAV